MTFWNERWTERFEEQRERVRTWWLGLAPREKSVLSVLAGLVVVLLMAVIIKETSVILNRVASQAESNYGHMERIQTWVSELQNQRASLMRYDRLKQQRRDDFEFQAFIEQEAKRFNINLSKSAPARVVGGPSVEKSEEWLEVDLKDAALENLVKFLASIEDTLGLRLVELQIKTQFQDPTKLDSTLIVSNKKVI